ncbi:hypothetical protein RFI_12671 [Reticulomyxa filosa]|uniref:Uncharacterized protein n=1 Tax=Reticulomyxa filosa TaxID=46433 RepID=X6NGK7_RETFI|nr:hypothetical protein RFI_12671 [Reticulomyxa filosa]|eukprot:ETO24487.1 hypothetical protein RFI_12671 [Reticulomyxa filosa]
MQPLNNKSPVNGENTNSQCSATHPTPQIPKEVLTQPKKEDGKNSDNTQHGKHGAQTNADSSTFERQSGGENCEENKNISISAEWTCLMPQVDSGMMTQGVSCVYFYEYGGGRDKKELLFFKLDTEIKKSLEHTFAVPVKRVRTVRATPNIEKNNSMIHDNSNNLVVSVSHISEVVASFGDVALLLVYFHFNNVEKPSNNVVEGLFFWFKNLKK